jgi:hypothetical protein
MFAWTSTATKKSTKKKRKLNRQNIPANIKFG